MFYWWAIAWGNNGEIEVMIMETEQMIIYLTRLETVLDDLGKLLFKSAFEGATYLGSRAITRTVAAK